LTDEAHQSELERESPLGREIDGNIGHLNRPTGLMSGQVVGNQYEDVMSNTSDGLLFNVTITPFAE